MRGRGVGRERMIWGMRLRGGMRKRRKLSKKQQQKEVYQSDVLAKQDCRLAVVSRIPYLSVLSGEFDIEIKEENDIKPPPSPPSQITTTTTQITMQSKPVFATAAIQLDHSNHSLTTTSNPLYYEITIITGGISQLG